MTQSSIKQNKDNESETKNATTKAPNHSFISDTCIQICAWVLLTLGLCILVTTFYLAIAEKQSDELNDYDGKDNDTLFIEFNKTNRVFDDMVSGAIDISFNGCKERLCKIACVNSDHIFNKLFSLISISSCKTTDVLLIERQQFPDGILNNSWLTTEHSVHELVISYSNITHIKSDAFNSIIFSSTFLLSLYDLNLEEVDSGALLGLYSLKYLSINTKIKNLNRAFFQPVQTTLTHLRLHAGLDIGRNENIFGVSYISKLEFLDLSYNDFSGPLTSKLFLSTPNLKYLVITKSKITSIASNAFDAIKKKLFMINLSHNLLTTVRSDVFAPVLRVNNRVFISLAQNAWNCNCDIRPLANVFTKYRNQFVETLYCKAPNEFYGTVLNELNFTDFDCDVTTTTATEPTEVTTATTTTKRWVLSTKHSYIPTVTTTEAPNCTDINTTQAELDNDNSEDLTVFKMRCLDITTSTILGFNAHSVTVIAQNHSIDMASTVSDTIESTFGVKNYIKNLIRTITTTTTTTTTVPSNIDHVVQKRTMEFEPPSYEFDLELLPNRTVIVTIDNFDSSEPVNIIWFSELEEDMDFTYSDTTIDYNCISYIAPYLLIDSIEENTTYTFCLIPYSNHTITPFNCLPLYVPKIIKYDENMWISEEDKQFTIGMLCMVFMLSTFFGAIVAYFGIKAYPDLLEGSKKVLVVKKSDQKCYVSTISETKYLKNASTKNTTNSLAKSNGFNGLYLDTPSPTQPTSPPINMNLKHLERLSSQKSTSTCFEDPFIPISLRDTEYELPKDYEKNHSCKERCIPNNYATSPCSPPPLPKRNSSQADNLNVMINRFGNPN